MDNSVSSDCEDINDLLIDGLDGIDQKYLKMAEDLSPFIQPFPSNSDNRNHSEDFIIDGLDLDLFDEEDSSTTPSNSNNHKVPIQVEPLNQPFSLQYPELDSNPTPKITNPVPSASYPCNVPIYNAPLSHPYPSQPYVPLPFAIPNHSIPQPHHPYYPPLNYALPCNDSFDAYWNSINSSAMDFMNFGYVNNVPLPHAVPYPTAHAYSAQVFDNSSTAANATSTATYSAPDDVHKPVEFAVYRKEKGKSSQTCRKFPDRLPEDKNRDIYHKCGYTQLWYFLLQLLADVTYKSTICWTGHQRFFKIKDTAELRKLWARNKNTNVVSSWESVSRTLRSCGANGILMAVPSKGHKGHNEDGVYGYVIEPSSYLGMTREQLDTFIIENCEKPLEQAQPSHQYLASPMINQAQNQHYDSQPQMDDVFQFFPNLNNPQSLAMQSQIHRTNARFAPY